ncbi:MAG TPA: GNAT family N-acetyltransferase [Actinobacteria bacterium]|nr:GNAT family N-acetyltransferase [Actinomycetota bacterium]
MKIDVITTEEEFKNIRKEWSDLLDGVCSSIFQTWEWQWTWWKHYRKGKNLFILTARENELIGIAPFYLSNSYLGLPIKVVSFLGTGPSDYGGFIVLQEKEEEFIETILAYLSASAWDWDVMDLHQIPQDLINVDHLEGLDKSFEYFKHSQDNSLVLTLPCGWDDYLKGLNSKFRYNLNYNSRRIQKICGANMYDVSEREEDISCGMNIFFDLHQKRWKSKKLPGLFWNKRYKDFHMDVAHYFNKKGWLALYFLTLDDGPIASLYGFRYNDCFYYYLGGYDPCWGRLSPGTVLTGEAIRDSITKGLSRFDFLRGMEKYKLKWGAVAHKNMRLLLCKKTNSLNIHSLSALSVRALGYENEILMKAKERLRQSDN